MFINYEQIKQGAFIDELQKIAMSGKGVLATIGKKIKTPFIQHLILEEIKQKASKLSTQLASRNPGQGFLRPYKVD